MLNFAKLSRAGEIESPLTGRWFTAKWIPDPGSGELLNIGVGFVADGGELSMKFAEDFTRLACLYDEGLAEFHAKLACQMAFEILSEDTSRRGKLTDNLIIEDRGYAQCADADLFVKQLFDDLVTIARPKTADRKQPFTSIALETAYNRIKHDLKIALGIHHAEHCPSDPYQTVNDKFGAERLYLPFRKSTSVATLTTAAYANPYRVKSNLYDGFRSVEIALQKKIAGAGAMFVVLPGDGLDAKMKTEIENEIDQVYAFTRRHHIHIESDVDVGMLGARVAEWCEVAAPLH